MPTLLNQPSNSRIIGLPARTYVADMRAPDWSSVPKYGAESDETQFRGSTFQILSHSCTSTGPFPFTLITFDC